MGRLTPGTVSEIKRLFWNGVAQTKIAADLGLGQSSVSDICTGRSFTHIPWPNGSYDPPARADRKRRRDGLEETALNHLADRSQPISITESIEEAAADAESTAAWKADLAALVEQVKETSDMELDEEMKRIVSSVQNLNTSAPEQEAPVKLELPIALPWVDIVRIAGPRNRWVRAAKEKPKMQYLLGVVYNALPPNDWAEPFIYSLLQSTAQMLGVLMEDVE